MKYLPTVRLLLLCGMVSCPAWSNAQQASHAISIGLISASTPERVLQDWKPFTDALARELDVPVHATASSAYSDIAKALHEGQIQLAWINNKLAVDLVESERATVFAQMVRLDGTRGYKSLLLVRKDSPIENLSDVFAKPGAYKFGSGGPQSLSGFVVPNYYVFAKGKIDVNKHFKTVSQGSHLENLLAVADGRLDIVTNNTEEIPRYQAEHPDKLNQVRILWQSPDIPNDPILMRTDVPALTQQKIRNFFFNYGRSSSEKSTLKQINGLSGFKPSSNYQLRPIVDLELFQALTKAMADKSASKDSFDAERERLTRKAAKLDALLNASRFDNKHLASKP